MIRDKRRASIPGNSALRVTTPNKRSGSLCTRSPGLPPTNLPPGRLTGPSSASVNLVRRHVYQCDRRPRQGGAAGDIREMGFLVSSRVWMLRLHLFRVMIHCCETRGGSAQARWAKCLSGKLPIPPYPSSDPSYPPRHSAPGRRFLSANVC